MPQISRVRGLSKARREVLDLVREWDDLDDAVATPASIAKVVGGTRQNAHKLLRGLAAQGFVYKDGDPGTWGPWRPVDMATHAKRHGASIHRVYSTLRLHVEALDAAIADTDDRDMKSLLRQAREEVYSAEDAITDALTLA